MFFDGSLISPNMNILLLLSELWAFLLASFLTARIRLDSIGNIMWVFDFSGSVVTTALMMCRFGGWRNKRIFEKTI